MRGPGLAVLLAPVEQTSSFLRGSELGPEAVAAELATVDRFDPEVGRSLDELGPRFEVRPTLRGLSLESSIAALADAAGAELDRGRRLLTLGGEHTVTLGPLRAVVERAGPVGLVQLDAHADLRESYEGRALSHACVVRRAVEDLGLPALGLGIRSVSAPEAEFLAADDRVRHLGPRTAATGGSLGPLLDLMPESVYLTIDMDAFDPAVAPGVGTAEVGGLTWPDAARIVDEVARRRRIVAVDLVELAPNVERHRTVRLAARVAIRALLRTEGLRPRVVPGSDVRR